MPISSEPLVRAALDVLERQVESQLHLRRHLLELDKTLASWERAETVRAAALPGADGHLRRLSALMNACPACQLTVTMPADPAVVPMVADGMAELMAATHWSKEDVFAVQLALQEAVANAIRHGCRGDLSKRVRCSVSCDSDSVLVVVRDPGDGFDPGPIADPLEGTNVLKPSGRGIFLIKALMDEVRFDDGGREVQMRKRKPTRIGAGAR
jgi:serine/threonine-protein kinase RsbW